ncbi:MAG: DUF4124 domain-containing protein [Desulfamplus sp.]|nr:DUF4124 domain-containing protein [Desulfamplus sp.]
MRINFILMMVVLIFSSFCCYAGQYYKFVDQNGVVSFTDDISKIPKEQRDKIEIKKAVKSSLSLNPSDNPSELQDKTALEGEEQQLLDKKKTEELDSEAKELKRIKEELDKEAEEINSASIKLIEENKDIKENKKIREYNVKIEELNERTKIYQAKQVEYVKRANEYNAKMSQQPVR